jgi:hypothetical protein
MFYWLSDDFLQMFMNNKVCKMKRARLAHLFNNMGIEIGNYYHPYASDEEEE